MCVLTPLIQAHSCWSRVESQAQWRVHFHNKLLSWAGELLCPLTGPEQGQMAARGAPWKLHLWLWLDSVWLGTEPELGRERRGRAGAALPLLRGNGGRLSPAGPSETLCQRTGLWSLHCAVWNNRRWLLLLSCPTGDAGGGFTVRFYSNFYSTGLNRPGVTQMCSYTADFPFSALPWSLQSKQTFTKILKKSLAPACCSCPGDWSGQECTGCSPTAEQKDDPCLCWSLWCKSDSIDQRQSPGG